MCKIWFKEGASTLSTEHWTIFEFSKPKLVEELQMISKEKKNKYFYHQITTKRISYTKEYFFILMEMERLKNHKQLIKTDEWNELTLFPLIFYLFCMVLVLAGLYLVSFRDIHWQSHDTQQKHFITCSWFSHSVPTAIKLV